MALLWPCPNPTRGGKWTGVYFCYEAFYFKRELTGHVHQAYRQHPCARRRPDRPMTRSGMLAQNIGGVKVDPLIDPGREGLSHWKLLRGPFTYPWHSRTAGRGRGVRISCIENHPYVTNVKTEHSGFPPLRWQCEATAAKAMGMGFTPALLVKLLPLGRGWGRQGEPCGRCAQKESISRKT